MPTEAIGANNRGIVLASRKRLLSCLLVAKMATTLTSHYNVVRLCLVDCFLVGHQIGCSGGKDGQSLRKPYLLLSPQAIANNNRGILLASKKRFLSCSCLVAKMVTREMIIIFIPSLSMVTSRWVCFKHYVK